MEKGTSQDLGAIIAEIIEDDNLPPNFLAQVVKVVQKHEDADALFDWIMQLSPHLRDRDIRAIGQLLKHGLAVLRHREELGTDRATTLSTETRATIRDLWENDDELSEPALYVLGFDVLTRAHNRTHQSESSPAE